MADDDRENHLQNADSSPSWAERGIALVVPLAPFFVSIFHARPTSDGTHDEAIVRAIGLGFTGLWRELDAIVAMPALLLPWSTSIHRAELSSALGAGLAAAALYRFTRALLARCAPATGSAPERPATGSAPEGRATWLAMFVAAIATWAATLGTAWQSEATSPGGATWGALLFLIFPLIFAEKYVQTAHFAIAGLACGLAISYEPLLGVAAVATAVTMVAASELRPSKKDWAQVVVSSAIGVAAPMLLAAWRRNVSPFAISTASWTTGWLGTTDPMVRGDLTAFAHAQLGWVALAAALAGAVLAAMVPKARALAFGILAGLAVLAFAIFLGAPIGPDRYAATSLAFVAAANVLAAVGMQAAVRAVARAHVPFAQASAAMIVVLELTFAAVALDESSLDAIAHKNKLGSRWDDEALEGIPEGALILISDPRVALHFAAARAAGTLRSDLTALILSDIGGRATLDALAQDPKLAPIVRDVALTGSASEFSLAALTTTRPLLVQYDAKWDKSLTRHLVPAGVFDAFEPEPHGVTDRKRALDAFLPLRAKLEKDLAEPRDQEMTAITASLLRARLDALVAIDEKEVLPRAIDDLRAFAPDDPTANRLVLKLVASRVGTPIK